jgi:hypothetical protein
MAGVQRGMSTLPRESAVSTQNMLLCIIANHVLVDHPNHEGTNDLPFTHKRRVPQDSPLLNYFKKPVL